MPSTIRESLSERIRTFPRLVQAVADLRLVSGVPIHFVTPLGHRTLDPAVCRMCRFLHAHPHGVRLCTRFLHQLLEAAHEHPASAVCDAGLRESAVPLRTGGQTFGYLVFGHGVDRPAQRPDHNRARHLLSRIGVTLDAAQVETLAEDTPVHPPERIAALERVVADLIERVVLEITQNIVHPPASLPPVVERACRLVRAEFARPLSLEALARELKVSPGHLSRIFHHSTGLRFVEYVARVRAEHARALLCTTEESVTEIAFACGFQSLSQFNRTMRAHFARTPRALRRDHRAAAA